MRILNSIVREAKVVPIMVKNSSSMSAIEETGEGGGGRALGLRKSSKITLASFFFWIVQDRSVDYVAGKGA